MRRAILASVACLAAFPAYADLQLTEMIVKQKLKAGVPYDVALRYKGDPSSIKEVCFLWSGEGPYCWANLRVDKKAKLVRTKARTGTPSRYELSGFVRYSGGETNRVSKAIQVNP